jgi:acyl-CoA synthetase (AMP-forming)/AMP-acid ligase II
MDSGWFFERLGQFGQRTALVWAEQQHIYADLLGKSDAWREVLVQQGVAPGECVALQGGFSPSTTTLLLALIAHGNIAVPLTSPSASECDRSLKISLADCLFRFNPDDSWSFSRRSVERKNPLLEEFRSSGDPGLILLSSGSTGDTKASLHSFARLMANYQKPRAAYRTLAFLLLDHIGGINTLFNIFGNGGTVVSLRERTPEAICRGIERHRVQLLPTTPTFLRMLLISEAYKKFDLGSLELITYGTEPMPSSTLEELHRVFPHARLKQTYGLTEVGILPSKSEGNDSLWLAVGGEGFETKIVDGVLWIRTPSAMIGYLNAPSPFDEQGWFNTGDVVERRGELIRFMGRKSEIINIGGEKVFPAEVENVIQQVENVKEVTVRGRPNAITGNIVVATVELARPEDPDALEARVRAACLARLAPYKVPALIEVASDALCSERFKKIRKIKARPAQER